MFGTILLWLDLAFTATIVTAAGALWSNPALGLLPLAVAAVIAFTDLTTHRIPIIAATACLAILVITGIHVHALSTTVIALAVIALVALARLLPIAQLRLIPYADLAAIGLCVAIAPAPIYLSAGIVLIIALLIIRRFQRTPIRLPVGGAMLGVVCAIMLLTRTGTYR